MAHTLILTLRWAKAGRFLSSRLAWSTKQVTDQLKLQSVGPAQSYSATKQDLYKINGQILCNSGTSPQHWGLGYRAPEAGPGLSSCILGLSIITLS